METFYSILFAIVTFFTIGPKCGIQVAPPQEEPVIEYKMAYKSESNLRSKNIYIEPENYEMTDDYIPDNFLVPCSQQGTIIDDENINALIYLPYNYDPDKSYNVLFLQHGMYGSKEKFMTYTFDFQDHEVQFSYLFDNLITENYISPLIIVTPYSYSCYYGHLDYESGEDVVRGWVDYIKANYHTKEFGFAGGSAGAIFTEEVVFNKCDDIFDWYGCLSGQKFYFPIDGKTVKYFYFEGGKTDSMNYGTQEAYNFMKNTTDYPCSYTEVPYGHEWSTWFIGVYNLLSVFYK